MPSFFGVDRRSKCGILICKAACRLTRTIFYLRCAAYLRPLPRTRLQRQQLKHDSRGRAMLASITKINLRLALEFLYHFLFHLPRRRCVPHVQLLYKKTLCCTCRVKADISIPLTHRLCSTHLKPGECLFCVQKNYNSTICFVKKYFAAPTADASFLYEQFFKYETSCSKPLYAITFSPSGII